MAFLGNLPKQIYWRDGGNVFYFNHGLPYEPVMDSRLMGFVPPVETLPEATTYFERWIKTRMNEADNEVLKKIGEYEVRIINDIINDNKKSRKHNVRNMWKTVSDAIKLSSFDYFKNWLTKQVETEEYDRDYKLELDGIRFSLMEQFLESKKDDIDKRLTDARMKQFLESKKYDKPLDIDKQIEDTLIEYSNQNSVIFKQLNIFYQDKLKQSLANVKLAPPKALSKEEEFYRNRYFIATHLTLWSDADTAGILPRLNDRGAGFVMHPSLVEILRKAPRNTEAENITSVSGHQDAISAHRFDGKKMREIVKVSRKTELKNDGLFIHSNAVAKGSKVLSMLCIERNMVDLVPLPPKSSYSSEQEKRISELATELTQFKGDIVNFILQNFEAFLAHYAALEVFVETKQFAAEAKKELTGRSKAEVEDLKWTLAWRDLTSRQFKHTLFTKDQFLELLKWLGSQHVGEEWEVTVEGNVQKMYFTGDSHGAPYGPARMCLRMIEDRAMHPDGSVNAGYGCIWGGDYLDRGGLGLECLLIPTLVMYATKSKGTGGFCGMLAGNHESCQTMQEYGWNTEVDLRMPP